MKVVVDQAMQCNQVRKGSPAHYVMERWLIGASCRAEQSGGVALLCDHVRAGDASPALMLGLVAWDPDFTVDFMKCQHCLAVQWADKAEDRLGWDSGPMCDVCRIETIQVQPAFAVFGSIPVFGMLCVECHEDSCGVRNGR